MERVMADKPLGAAQNFCSKCGVKLHVEIPGDDNRLRYVCGDCGTVHYENPKVVAGCVTEYEGRILLCRRAIEPRYDCWTVPAGFMELGETVAEAAARETLEEACATVKLGSMLAVIDVVQAGQVHIFYRGTLVDGKYAAGSETLEAQLFAPADIPWDEIAFHSGYIALKQYLAQSEAGAEFVHSESAGGLPPR
jgi:ADP-ribose pyrophosphatase YjhB (NUDIX family)